MRWRLQARIAATTLIQHTRCSRSCQSSVIDKKNEDSSDTHRPQRSHQGIVEIDLSLKWLWGRERPTLVLGPTVATTRASKHARVPNLQPAIGGFRVHHSLRRPRVSTISESRHEPWPGTTQGTSGRAGLRPPPSCPPPRCRYQLHAEPARGCSGVTLVTRRTPRPQDTTGFVQRGFALLGAADLGALGSSPKAGPPWTARSTFV